MANQNPVFIPGPTNTPDRIRRAIDVQTQDHRASDFIELFKPVFADVKAILKTQSADVFIFPSTGTGGWEAAITNTLSPGDKILIARYGQFSHRWIDLCQRHGLDVQIIEEKWGNGCCNGRCNCAGACHTSPTDKPRTVANVVLASTAADSASSDSSRASEAAARSSANSRSVRLPAS